MIFLYRTRNNNVHVQFIVALDSSDHTLDNDANVHDTGI